MIEKINFILEFKYKKQIIIIIQAVIIKSLKLLIFAKTKKIWYRINNKIIFEKRK